MEGRGLEASASWDKEEAAVEACATQEGVGGNRGKDGREPHAPNARSPSHPQGGEGSS